MTTACDHPAGSAIYNQRELIPAYGPTVLERVPQAPGIIKLVNDLNAPVHLSRLACGHFAMTSPTTRAEHIKQLEEKLGQPLLRPLQKAEAELKRLLNDVRAGKEIEPAEVTLAREAVELARIAEEGERERLIAQMEKEQQEAREALEGPLAEELGDSRANLDALQTAAFRAIVELLDAVEEDQQLHEDAARELVQHGADPALVQQSRGYRQITHVGGRQFEHSMKLEWLIGILNQVKHHTKHRGLHGIEGRDLGNLIPPNTDGTPVPEP